MADFNARTRTLPSDAWDKLEPIIHRFETAWFEGGRPDLDDYLPQAGPERRAVLIELAHADLECRLKAGEAARADLYLQRYPELREDARAALDLIAAEYRLRRQREPGLGLDEYARRFPQHREQLAACLQAPAGAAQVAAEAATPPPSAPETRALQSGAALLDVLRDARLLEPAQLEELADLRGRFPELRALARELLQRGWLTPFQVNLLCQGRGRELALGPYLLLERLGQGGMGQVFKARHRLMKRTVALKVIRKDLLAHPDTVQRFQREIQAAAQLNHPNIVIAHDAEQCGDVHFLVMEFVEGVNLAALLKQRGPLPVSQACDYIRQAALGLQHAHERGLVHRDVKPSNLLLTTRGGVIKVLDLGLARLELGHPSEPTDTHLTEVGAVMGTPDYMAPEQALDSRQVDPRSDLYSLGCTFYHLLTGQPPFPSGSITQKLLWHQQAEPTPVEQLRADLPAGLTLVLRKLMAKHPGDRYQSAGEAAGALEFFCRYAIPVASPTPDRGAASAALPVAAPEQAPTVGSHDTVAPSAPRPQARLRPPRRTRLLLAAGAALVLLAAFLVWRFRPRRPGAVSPAEEPPAPGEVRPRWLAWKPPPELIAILGEDRGQHWSPVRCVAVSPDGKRAASAGDDQTIRLWDTATMTGVDLFKGHSGSVSSLVFSPDGKHLLSGGGDNIVRLWEIAGGKEARRFPLNGVPWGVAFSANGEKVFTLAAEGNGVVSTWDARDGRELSRFAVTAGHLAWSPDGRRCVSGANDGILRLWDALAGRELQRYEAPVKEKETRPRTLCVALAPDGQSALFGTDTALLLWSLTEKPPRLLARTPGAVLAVAFSPDGKRIVSGGTDGQVRLWDVRSGKEVRPGAGHTGPVLSLGFSGDGRRLLSGGADRTARLWDVSRIAGLERPKGKALYRLEELALLAGHPGWVTGVALSSGGRWALAGTSAGSLSLWDVAGREVVFSRSPYAGHPLVFCPDGTRALAVRGDGNFRSTLLDLDTGQELRSFVGPTGPVRCVALSPNGKRLLSSGDDYLIRLYDRNSGKELRRFPGHVDTVGDLAFRDNRTFLSASADRTIGLWTINEKAARQQLPLEGAPENSPALAFGPHGKLVVGWTGDGRVLVWDSATGRKRSEWRLPGRVNRVAVAPDGRHVVSANGNGTLYLFRLPAEPPG
jgi:WD40 repeat protein/serine/threonine protein kinase